MLLPKYMHRMQGLEQIVRNDNANPSRSSVLAAPSHQSAGFTTVARPAFEKFGGNLHSIPRHHGTTIGFCRSHLSFHLCPSSKGPRGRAVAGDLSFQGK
jgi:hypothetical protein